MLLARCVTTLSAIKIQKIDRKERGGREAVPCLPASVAKAISHSAVQSEWLCLFIAPTGALFLSFVNVSRKCHDVKGSVQKLKKKKKKS